MVTRDYFQEPPLGRMSNTKPGDHDTLNAQLLIYSKLLCVRTRMNRNDWK